MKNRVLKMLAGAGVFGPFRMLHRRHALILTYHRFSVGGASGTLSSTVFEWQIRYLHSRFNVLSLGEFVSCLTRDAPMPPRSAVITIDDGYRDAYEIAFPILRRYRLPATLFVTTSFVDRTGWMWGDKLRYILQYAADLTRPFTISGRPYSLDSASGSAVGGSRSPTIHTALARLSMEDRDRQIERLAVTLGVTLPELPGAEFEAITWDQAREMDRHGVAIESHTVHHPTLTYLDEPAMRRELIDSRTRLETVLERPVGLLCYPHGDHNDRVVTAAADAGYRGAVTTVPGFNDRKASPLRLRRIDAPEDVPHFLQSVSGAELLKNRLRGSIVAHPRR